MKRLVLAVFLMLFLGCAGFKPFDQKVEGNTFYCSSPKLEVEVSQELHFVGEEKMRQDFEGRDYQRPGTAYHKAFTFLGMNNLLGITVIKLPRNWTYMPSSFDDVENKLDYGKQKLGNHNYHYVTVREGPYIKRLYVRNAHTDTARIHILYIERLFDVLLSEEEQLRLLNKHCVAAFAVK